MICERNPNYNSFASKVSRPAVSFIEMCLEKDQDSRPDAATLLNHIWLQNVRTSVYNKTDFNQAFSNLYSYSKVDHFTTAISSYVANSLL